MKQAYGIALILLLAACQSTPPAADPPPAPSEAPVENQSESDVELAPLTEEFDGPIQSVVVDTDMSLDDLIAIAMLVESPAKLTN